MNSYIFEKLNQEIMAFCVSHYYIAAENQNRGLLQAQQVLSATNPPGK